MIWTEREDSRKITAGVSGETARLHFFGRGPEYDDAAARAAFIAMLPITWDGLVLQNVELTPLGSSGNWDCVADYAFSNEQLLGEFLRPDPGPDDPLGIEWGFDLTAATVHISQSIQTVASRAAGSNYASPPAWAPNTGYSPPNKVINNGNIYICNVGGVSAATGGGPTGTGTGISDGRGDLTWNYVGQDVDPAAANYHGAIGATRDRISGTDVFAGHLELTLTAQAYPMTQAILDRLAAQVGTINSAAYKGRPAKTLLYLGCTGTCKPGQVWTLCHRWAYSPNLTDVKVGPDIVMPFKAGWDFLWAEYQPKPVGAYMLPIPTAAYVEQVYRLCDFSTLPA